MRNRNSNWWIWVLIFFGITSFGSFIPLLLIIGVVLAVTFATVESSKQQDRTRSYTRTTGRRTTTSRTSQYSTSDIARINVYLRKWFRDRSDIAIGNHIGLRVRGSRYASLASLDVYRDGSYVCSMNDFERNYPDSYAQIIRELVNIANANDDIYDVEVKPTPKPEPKKQEEPQRSKAEGYIETIEQLNNNIPDEEITNGLYETCALLKQIKALEEKFPNSKSKLEKLYEYYLPILVRILTQYDALQSANHDDTYEETRQKLSRTVTLINDAMRKIISSMTDQDFINLSADISTLEAVLQKDGLTEEGQINKEGF